MNKSTINTLIKIVLAILIIGTIYHQINTKDSIEVIFEQFKEKISLGSPIYLIITILISPISRFCQAINWQQFLKKNYVNPIRAAKGVLIGVAMGIFTPNAVGAYPGRLLVLKKEDHWEALSATFLESISFMVIILVVGSFSIAMFDPLGLIEQPDYQFLIWIWASISIFICLFVYFNISLTIKWSKRFRFMNRFIRKFVLIEKVNPLSMKKGLLFSSIRFSIQMIQYLCLFLFFDLNIGSINILLGMSCLYFFRLGLPLPNALNSLVSGELMLLIFGDYAVNELSLVAIAFGIWIINIVFPALIGLGMIYTTNIIKTIGYEK